MALLTCWLQALAIVAWFILTTALVFTTTARITSERQTVCIPNFAERISCFDKNFVIPAQAGTYFDFAPILRIQSKIKMDPSLRWDNDFDELRLDDEDSDLVQIQPLPRMAKCPVCKRPRSACRQTTEDVNRRKILDRR